MRVVDELKLDLSAFACGLDLPTDAMVAGLDANKLVRVELLHVELAGDLVIEALGIAAVVEVDVLNLPPVVTQRLGVVAHRG